MKQDTRYYIATIFFVATAVFLGISFIFWTLIPYLQERRYVMSLRRSDGVVWVRDQQNVFTPVTFVQPDIRDSFLNRSTAAYKEGNIGEEALLFAVERLEVVLTEKAHYPKYYLSLARAYTALANGNRERRDEFLDRAAFYCKQAYVLIPESPEVASVYGVTLINQKKYEEAMAIVSHSLAQVPNASDTRYVLGVILFHMGEARYAEALEHLERGGEWLEESSVPALYRKLFAYFYHVRDTERFLTVVHRLQIIDKGKEELYNAIDSYMKDRGVFPRIAIED